MFRREGGSLSENRRGGRDRDEGRAFRRVKLAFCAVLAIAACATVFVLFSKCRAMWIAQCAVADVREQVKITATAHIRPSLVLELFGLTNGCNLAEIDFDRKRAEILESQPMIKTLSVTRRLPDRLEIRAEERKPAARVNYSEVEIADSAGRKSRMGRWQVADAEGVVFNFNQRETRLLPRIVEGRPSAKTGQRLSGRALAALRLIDLCARHDFPGITLLDADVTNPTYLVAATGDYNTLKIDWNLVHDPESPSQPEMRRALGEIQGIVANRLAGSARSAFIVSESGRINVIAYGREAAK